LTREEYDACLDRLLSNYYEFLAISVKRRRDGKFWEYHKKKLTDAGVGFDRVRLAKAILSKATSAVLNPKDTIGKFFSRSHPVRDPEFVPGFKQEKGSL